MLFILLKTLYILGISFIYGNAILAPKQATTAIAGSPQLFSFGGLAIIAVIAAIFSFFGGLGSLAVITITAAAIALVFLRKALLLQQFKLWQAETSSLPTWLLVSFFLATIFIFYCSSLQSLSIDEGHYHAPFIRMAKDYGIVIGSGNFEMQMGFNSHWHLLSALFSLDFITGQASNHINAALLVLLLLYCLPALALWGKKPMDVSCFLRGAFPIFAAIPHFFAYHLIAPSSDLATIYLGFITVLLFIEKAERGEAGHFDAYSRLMVLLWTFALTIKLSALFLFPFVFYCFLQLLRQKRYKNFAGEALLVAVVVLPWLVRNVLLTGYLIFPIGIDLFNFDWEVPVSMVKEVNEAIHDMGFKLYSDQAVDNSKMQLLPKIASWFVYNLRIFDQAIIVFSLILSFLAIGLKVRGIRLFVYATLFFCLLFWLLNAPDPRFAYAYFALLSLLSIFFLFQPLLEKFKTLLAPGVMLFFMLSLTGSFIIHRYLYKKFTTNGRFEIAKSQNILLLPTPYPESETLCWDKQTECLFEKNKDKIKLRGNSIKDGLSPKE